jgi:ketosteroid isomerase-like protein
MEDATMYRRLVVARVRSTWRRMAGGDLAAAAASGHPDMTFRFVGDTPLGADLRGVDAFRQWLEELAVRVPGLSFAVQDVLVGGWPWNTRVAVRFEISAPLPGGATYRNEGVQWLRLRWGRLVDDWVLEDTLALTRGLERLSTAP